LSPTERGFPGTKGVLGAKGGPPVTSFGSGRRFGGVDHQVDTAVATLVRDPSQTNAWHLLLDGVESSYVDLDDPTVLAFEYMRWFGDVLDEIAPPQQALSVVHLGGAGVTLARYVSQTRPDSRQLVAEVDAALVELVRQELPLPKRSRPRIRIEDARALIGSLRPQSYDVIVRDTFADAVVPAHLRTVEFTSQVDSVLKPNGVYLLNVADGTPFRLIGAELATVLEVFPEVAVIYEPAVVKGRRHGNFVVVAASAAHAIPLDAIGRRVMAGGPQGRLRRLPDVVAMARGHRPYRDLDAELTTPDAGA
jgi:spermidine synthase